MQRYEQQVSAVPVPSAAVPKLPTAAFGVDLAAANEVAAQKMAATGNVIAQRAIEMQQQKDMAAVVDADTRMKAEVQELLYSKDVGSDGKPKGLLNRDFSNANGITQEYDAAFRAIREKYGGQMVSPQMQAEFGKLSGHYMASVRGAVIEHEAKNIRIGRIQDAETNMDMAASNRLQTPTVASLNALKADYEVTGGVLTGYLGREGVTALTNKKLGAAASAAIAVNITNGNTSEAKAILDTFGPTMNTEQMARSTGLIASQQRNQESYTIAQSILSKVPMRNGVPDYAEAMRVLDETLGPNSKKTETLDQASVSKWITGDTNGMSPILLNRLARLAAAKGVQINIDDGYRTYDQQRQLWEKSDKTGKMVAAPGNSRHEAGFAIDASSQQWLRSMSNEELAKYGLHKPMDYEDWHIEPVETKGKATSELRSLGTTASNFDPEFYARTKAVVEAAVRDAQAGKVQRESTAWNDWNEWIRQGIASGNLTNESQIVSQLNALGVTGETYTRMLHFGVQEIGRDHVTTSMSTWNEAHDRILAGDIRDVNQLRAEFGGRMSNSDLKSFTSVLDVIGRRDSAQGVLGLDGVKTAIKEIATKVNHMPEKDYEANLPQIYAKIGGELSVLAKEHGGAQNIPKEEIDRVIREQTAKTIVGYKSYGPITTKQTDYLFKVPPGAVWVEGKGWMLPKKP